MTAVATCTDVQYIADISVSCDPGDANGTIYGVGNIINNCGGGGGGPWTPPSDPSNPPNNGQTGGTGNGDMGQDEPFDPYYMPPNFEDPNGVYFIYKKTIQEKRDEYSKVLRDSTKSEKAKSEARILYNEYNEAIKELKKIEQSTFKYHISRDINREDGYTAYNPTLNRIEIVLPRPDQDGTRGLEAHEFKHAYQFETGKISFNKTTGGRGKAYDLHDEKEAYQRQHFIKFAYRAFFLNYKETIINYTPYGYEVTLADVLTMGLEMTPIAYQDLPTTPKDVTSLLAAGEDMSNDVYVNPNP
jgi:hypothetical protein